MCSNAWLDGDVGSWFLRSLTYDVKHPLLSWAVSGQKLRHGDLVCLRGDAGTGKTLILSQVLAEFLMPQSTGGLGTACLLLLGNDNFSPHLLREQIFAKLARYQDNWSAAGKLEDVLSQSFANLHVVSVGSVDQLQQFVKSLPELLSGSLRCCRVVFVDDLDLGMASLPLFAPQIARLTDVVHSFLQATALHGLLVTYALNRRVAPPMNKSIAPFHANAKPDSPQEQPQTTTFLNPKHTCKAAMRPGETSAGIESASCQLDVWRAPRRFVLHLFRDSTKQQRIYSWGASHFFCASEQEGNCAFVVDSDSQIRLLNS